MSVGAPSNVSPDSEVAEDAPTATAIVTTTTLGEEEEVATTGAATNVTANGDAAGEGVAAGKVPTENAETLGDAPTEGAHDDADKEDLDEAEGASEQENAVEISGIPPNDVKNIILQVISPYFDDEGGEDDAQRYDHIKAQGWIQLICDGIMEKLLTMRRPYKFVVHCMIMRKCGAGIHVCSSCYYSQADGWVNHAHDLSAHIYAVVTVYWSVI